MNIFDVCLNIQEKRLEGAGVEIPVCIALMAAEGLVKDEDIDANLGEILNGKKTGRDNDDQIIYFNAVGAGILDLAVTTRCYRKALELGKGVWLPYWA